MSSPKGDVPKNEKWTVHLNLKWTPTPPDKKKINKIKLLIKEGYGSHTSGNFCLIMIIAHSLHEVYMC